MPALAAASASTTTLPDRPGTPGWLCSAHPTPRARSRKGTPDHRGRRPGCRFRPPPATRARGGPRQQGRRLQGSLQRLRCDSDHPDVRRGDTGIVSVGQGGQRHRPAGPDPQSNRCLVGAGRHRQRGGSRQHPRGRGDQREGHRDLRHNGITAGVKQFRRHPRRARAAVKQRLRVDAELDGAARVSRPRRDRGQCRVGGGQARGLYGERRRPRRSGRCHRDGDDGDPARPGSARSMAPSPPSDRWRTGSSTLTFRAGGGPHWPPRVRNRAQKP